MVVIVPCNEAISDQAQSLIRDHTDRLTLEVAREQEQALQVIAQSETDVLFVPPELVGAILLEISSSSSMGPVDGVVFLNDNHLSGTTEVSPGPVMRTLSTDEADFPENIVDIVYEFQSDGIELDREMLSKLDNAVSEVRHSINNPLTILSGNAQYLLQIARLEDLDDEIVQALEDMNAASEKIYDVLEELNDLDNFLSSENGSAD